MPRVPFYARYREPSRNDYCPCGSGKKYKHCCGAWAEAGGRPVQAGTSAIDAQVRARLKDLRLPRYAESPPSEFLAALMAGLPQAGAALARLAAFDADETVVRDTQMLLFTAFRDHGVAAPLRERLAGTAVPVLRAALKDAGLSDDRKYELGPLIDAAGIELPRREYEACFRDFAGTVTRRTAEALKGMSATAREVEGALRAHGLMEDDEPVRPGVDDFKHVFAYGAGFAELNPAAGGLFLATAAAIAAEHGKAPLDAQAALLRVRETGTPLAAWCLAELGAWPALGALGEKACELAEAMRAEGVRPSRPPLLDFSHGIISNVDGLGSRNLLLFFRTPTGALDGLVFMPNDEVGIKSIFCAYGQGAEIEPKLRERPGVMFASASMLLARELLGEALAVHAERGLPPPGRLLLFRHLLGEEPVAPRRRRPNLGAYALELLPRSPALAEGSERLCDDPMWEEFWFACDAAFEFVRKNRLQARGEMPPRFAPALVERFAREMEPHERKHLISRMEVCLETAVWAGRAAEPMFRLAARTWVVLSEGLQSFHEVPFVRALARRGLEHVSINVAMGFRNQREVNVTRPD